MDGMDSEKERDEKSAGQLQANQDAEQDESVCRMEQDVNEVIPERIRAPETMLDPKRCADQWIELMFSCLEPDGHQPAGVVHGGVVRDIGPVVPDEIAEEGRHIPCDYQESDFQEPSRHSPRRMAETGRADHCGAPDGN